MTPPLPEIVPSGRELELAEALEEPAVPLSVVGELAADELVADVLAAAELAGEDSTLLDCGLGSLEVALEAIGPADELALDIIEVPIVIDDIAEAAGVAAVDEGLDAAGVELPQADRPRTQATRRAEADLPVLFTVQTVGAVTAHRWRSRKCRNCCGALAPSRSKLSWLWV